MLALILTAGLAVPERAQAATGISSKIADAEAAVETAKADLKTAQKKYEKEKADAIAKVTVTDSDMEGTGREFIDSLIKEAYAEDKNSVTGIMKQSELTVSGCIKRAKANATCKAAIDEIDKTSVTFDERVDNALSTDNLYKAIDLMKKCNTYRTNETDSNGNSLGLKAYRVSPYLMASAAVSAAIGTHTLSHTYVNESLLVACNGKKGYENYGYNMSDPFSYWYTAEKAGTAGTKAHYNQIMSKNYKQTGASWINVSCKSKSGANVTLYTEQCFVSDSSGTSYTVTKFKSLLTSYINDKKQQIYDEKVANLSIVKKKPTYLKNAEAALDDAYEALSDVVKAYKPEISVTNYAYNKLKVSYKIPTGLDGIKIYRSVSGKTGTFILKKTKTSGKYFINTSLTSGKTYYYKAKLYKTVNGKKVYTKLSDCVSLAPEPVQVTGLTVTKLKSGKLRMTWDEVEGASGYSIYVKKVGESSYKALKKDTDVYGLILENREASDPAARALITTSGEYIIKVRAYRKVNGTTVKGKFSETVRKTV